MGSVYSFSLYRQAIEVRYGVNRVFSGVPYMGSLFFYAISMRVSGRFLTIGRFKSFVLTGGGLFVLAWLAAAFSPNIWVFSLSYGVLMGWAVGMLYGAALSFIQWYALDNHGYLSGLMLLGFGLSSVVIAPLAQQILSQQSLALLFTLYGSVALVIFVPLTVLLPKDEDGIIQPSLRESSKVGLKTVIFFLATTVGLTIIGLTGTIGIELYGYEPTHVALMISLFALLNALSRPLFGFLMDRFGFAVSASLSLALMVLATVLNSLNQGAVVWVFIIGYGLYWFNLGAWLSMMPTYIKQRLGKARYAQAYGTVFLGYGVAAIAGTLFASAMLDWFAQTLSLYLFLGGIITVLAIAVKRELTQTQKAHLDA